VRVPTDAKPGPLMLRARFDTGPLAGVLEASAPVTVKK
jgi:hypothetical protein